VGFETGSKTPDPPASASLLSAGIIGLHHHIQSKIYILENVVVLYV
jgi:hypothetical protein